MPLESMGKMPLEKLRPRSMEAKKATKTLLSIVAFSTLSHLTFTPLANARPDGGNLVGGSGSIDTSGLTTNIIQSSASMAIDWNSYNLSSNEVVNYLQPNASSISLNRILSSDASQIYGQINANGQVVLVNPNGIFFGETASINVGGLIASGLDISPTDFMNGDYIFNQVIGTGGTVINSGLINASLGGNVTLLAKQVANKGVINAKLGAVNLAAGKEAVLTFDNQGLIGVQITKEVLQEELGVDPAVLNSGEINTNGGRVLLTSSVSRDVFSDAVNHGDQQQASSVVVHEDGSFTLGGGADVVNSGTINVSAEASNDAGQVVILGENITHTGSIHADSKSGPVGMVELHSMDTTELRGDALISAQASLSENGGQIKILGEKVGLYDTSEINASGIHGGGEILVGGDRLGFNSLVRNAKFLYLGENSNIFADAITDGNGGRIITYASDTGRFYGGLYARGGVLGGDGGFIETSGKKGFELPVAPDVSAASGEGGLWLIDPYDITIQSSGGPSTYIEDIVTSPPDTFYTSIDPGLASTSTIDVAVIEIALGSGNVEIITDASDGGGQAGNIIFAAGLNYDGVESKSLTLNAAGGITFINGSSISDIDDKDDSLNVNLYAIGDVLMGTVIIDTQGGNLTVGGSGGNTPASFINNGTIDTTGWENIAGGDISITANDTITSTALTANGGTASNNHDGTNAGAITLHAVGAISVTGDISAIGSDGNEGGGGGDQWVGGSGGIISVASSATSVTTGNINNYGGNADGGGGANANGGNAGNITLSSQVGGGSITLTGRITSYGGTELGSGTTGNKSDITLDGNVTLANSLVLDVNSFSSGNLNARGAVDSIGSNIDITSSTNITTGSITTSGGSASLNSAGNNAGFISLDATNNINVNGAIYSSGSAANAMGNGGDAGLVYLLSGGQTSVSDITALGGIGVASDGSTADTTIATQTLNFNGVAAQTISGNDVLITASNGATLQQSLALYATSNATLNTNGNDINYHGIGTAGSLAMTAGNDIILNGNLVDTIVPDTDKLTVTLTANDDENGIGDINVTGTFTTNGGEFTATGVNYDGFSNTSVDTGSSNAFIAMTDAVALGGMDIGGTLDITASGGNISQSSDGIAVIGTTTLTATGNNIILDSSNNDLSGVSFTATNVTLLDINDIQLNTSTALGGLAVTANGNGNITQVGNLSVTSGDSAFTANGGDIILASTGNNFSTVTLDASNVNLWDADSIVLGASSITGTVNVVALGGGDITQSDTLNVTGLATFSVDGGQSIDLSGFANDFQGGVSFGANSGILQDVSVRNTSTLDLSAINVLRHLDVVVDSGQITNSGSLIVGGVASFDAGTNNVSLDIPTNDFKDIVILNAGTATINDINGINIGTTDATSGVSNADSNITGNLTITTALPGDVTDNENSAVIVGGIANFDVAAGNVILDSATNDLATVNILNGQNVTLVNSSGTGLQSTAITGNLNVTADGDIVTAGSLNVTGTSSFTTTGGNSITIDDLSNQLGGLISFDDTSGSLANLAVTNTLATNVQILQQSNNLDIISGGAITQTGAIDIASTTTLSAINGSAVSQNITLTNLANNFNNLTVSGAADLTLVDSTGDLTINNINVSGTANFTTSGAIIDGNGASMNVIASLLQIISDTGIGSTDEIETQVSSINIVNTGGGDVQITQTGDVEIVVLQNAFSGGNINLISSSTSDFNFHPGSVVAAGDIDMFTLGSFLGIGLADMDDPDITAANAEFTTITGTFGTFARPLTLSVPGSLTVTSATIYDPLFSPGPFFYDPQGIQLGNLNTVSIEAGESQIEIESLAEIDPAIFTDLRNYSNEDIAILMPRDQRYDDELEEGK